MPPVVTYEQELEEHRSIVDGSDGAFARWLARHEDGLRRSLRRYARSVDIEVIVQEASLRLWQHASRIRPDGKPRFLYRWTLRVARNLAVDAARRSSPDTVTMKGDEPEPLPPRPPDPMLRKQILRCFKKLSEKRKQALNAILENGGVDPEHKLAERIGMTYSAFRQNVARGRAALEECLKGFGIDLRNQV